MRSPLIKAWLAFLLCLGIQVIAFCQKSEPAITGKFYAVASHYYSFSDGLPDRCVDNMLIDSAGRMHLTTCYSVTGMQDWMVFTYDGFSSHSSVVDYRGRDIMLPLLHTDSKHRYYGYYEISDGKGSESGLFIFDPKTGQTTLHTVGQPKVQNMRWATWNADKYYVLTTDSTNYYIWAIDEDLNSELLASFKWPYAFGHTPMTLNSRYFWVLFQKAIVRIDRSDASIDTFETEYASYRMGPAAITGPGDTVWLSLAGSALSMWDPVTESIQRLPYSPFPENDITGGSIHDDISGNIIVEYSAKSGQGVGYLIDEKNEVYDYSDVLGLAKTGFFFRAIGEDFRREVALVNDGMRFIEVTTERPISVTPIIKNTRSIGETDNGDIIVFEPTIGVHLIKGDTSEILSPECGVYASFDCEWSKDDEGYFWIPGTEEKGAAFAYFIRWHPTRDECETFKPGIPIEQFTINKNGDFLIGSRGHLFSWNLRSAIPLQLSTKQYEGKVAQVFEDKNDIIWFATSIGLFRYDAGSKEIRKVNLHQKSAVAIQRIYQDEDGIFWLGTANRGLFRYNSESGDVSIIDRTRGLLNNIVPSILEDDHGVLWVGTFDGINLVSKEGVVIGKVTEDDGLIESECNRWSSLKLSDGRLCFGSVSGVSIINPDIWNRLGTSRRAPQIYLTSISSSIPGNPVDAEDYTAEFRNNRRITLTADNRNIRVAFALSNYAAPEKNTFSYRLELPGEDWNYIGNQRELQLNSLNPGSYNLIVRGTDGRGLWSDPPIIIPLDVKNYFYKQWWFYALCSIPFIVFLFSWIYRQRQEKKHLEDEVLKRTATIREQKAKLEELDHVKSQLYTNITHEFRTPLTVIMGMAEQLKSKIKDPEIQKGVNTIERNSANLLGLVNQMLDLRKLEAGAMPIHYLQDNVVRFLRYMAESFQSLANAKDIHFRFLTDEKEFFMDYDSEKLRQIISNLLSNAIKFTDSRGEIYLQFDHHETNEGEWAVIKVRDTGHGIPEEKLPFIFERFYQVDDSSTRSGEGTGIGLTLTSELVKVMKGEIQVSSRLGEGTVFTITLPVTREAPFPHDENLAKVTSTSVFQTDVSASPVQPASIASGNDKSIILVVEDNADVVHYLVLCLQDRYDILIAMNGQEGIDSAIESIPDLIVSDVMMPLRDGFDLCNTLKEDERTSHIPIILLTAKADVDSRLTGLKYGADAYLPKPFNKDELQIRIEQLITLRKKLQRRYALLEGDGLVEIEGMEREDAFVTRFRDVVLSQLDDETLDANQLSRSLGISRTQLHRKIKALTGKSTMEFMKHIRIEQAKEQLGKSDLTIAEVAYATGFKYPETFTRAFQEACGMTPSEWRANRSDSSN